MRYPWIALALVAFLGTRADASNVLVLSSGSNTLDTDVVNVLTGFGHSVSLGPEYTAFDNTVDLTGVDAIYFQNNANWTAGDIPLSGQNALLSYVNGGGGLVTSEWVLWNNAASGRFATLATAFPSVSTASFNASSTATFAVNTVDPVVSAGLGSSFTFNLDSFSGTETNVSLVKAGATVFYDSTTSGALGLVGWDYGAGRVLNFSTVNGSAQVLDPNFGRLLSNSLTWASANAVVAPEPGTFALAGLGLIGLALSRRRRS
jgi:hypothetical protein